MGAGGGCVLRSLIQFTLPSRVWAVHVTLYWQYHQRTTQTRQTQTQHDCSPPAEGRCRRRGRAHTLHRSLSPLTRCWGWRYGVWFPAPPTKKINKCPIVVHNGCFGSYSAHFVISMRWRRLSNGYISRDGHVARTENSENLQLDHRKTSVRSNNIADPMLQINSIYY